jgi:GNAT superfamily N-acetyltransferase
MEDASARVTFRLEPVDPADSQQVASFYRAVLAPHFRDDELERPESFAAGLRGGGSAALAALAGDGAIVGGAVTDWFPRSQVLLLSYLAVLPGYRSAGIGSRLMAVVRGEDPAGRAGGGTDPRPPLIVAEVEDPRHYPSDPVMGDPHARVRFYERLGGRTLPVPYAQPALGPGRSRVPHLLLMVLGGSMAPPGTPRVGGEPVAAFLREYFEGCEGPLSPDDGGLQALLAAWGQPAGLPLLLAAELPGEAP